MDALDSPRVLDRAPALLRSPCNFYNVRPQPVGIRAVRTVQRLECIQVSQFGPALRLRYAVDREANGLVR